MPGIGQVLVPMLSAKFGRIVNMGGMDAGSYSQNCSILYNVVG